MFGSGPFYPGARVVDGLIYQPYYVWTFAIAAVVVWAAPQTWDWTRRLPGWKAVLVTGLLWLALLTLMTQAFNPFIYFIF